MASNPCESRATPVLQIDDSIRSILRLAIEEDLGPCDVTSVATVPETELGTAKVIAKQDGVVCGTPVFKEVFRLIDPSVRIKCHFEEGDRVDSGSTVLSLEGPLIKLLQGERVALNYLGMLSGISTTTRLYVESVKHTKCKITDTRKTVPLMRTLQKYAVRVGGGINHRMGLHDMVLIKENHIDGCNGLLDAVDRVRQRWGKRFKIEVETRNLDEVQCALRADVDRIMLDNMDIPTMEKAVRVIHERVETEASGGVTIENVAAVAETGVDYISVGALTHSVKCMDYSKIVIKNVYFMDQKD